MIEPPRTANKPMQSSPNSNTKTLHPYDRFEDALQALWTRYLPGLTGYALLLPGVLVIGVLFVGLLFLADASFHLLDLSTFRLGEAYSLGNYQKIFSQPLFITVFIRSFWAATLVTLITLALAFPYAYLMVRTASPIWRKFLLFSLFLPFFLGQVVKAYGWLVLLGKEGMVNTLLVNLGLGPANMLYHFPAVVFGLVQYMLPFAVLMIAPAIVAIPKEIEQVSASLGAHWIATFRYLILPLARPGMLGAAVVVFTITLTDYAMPAIMGGGRSEFVANLIYTAFFNMSDAGLGSALSMVLILVGSLCFALLVFVFGQREVRARVAS